MKYGVFIGRFQPFHNGHKFIIEEALKHVDSIIICIGSSFLPRSVRNPFTYDERVAIISNTFRSNKIRCVPIQDHMYNDEQWISEITNSVISIAKDNEIFLVGHSKDSSSYYLKLFPQWKSIEISNYKNINATDIRNSYFSDEFVLENLLPDETYNFLNYFRTTLNYNLLKGEYNFIKQYKKQWEKSPYPPTFVTVDSIVIQSGHILLVKRRSYPGKGLYALPGGFINSNERISDAVLRELKEETRIDVPNAVLKGSIEKTNVYDHPDRSQRGRTITHAFLFRLENKKVLPKIKGGDDAEKALWVPFSKINSENMFEDHYSIIEHMLGVDLS